MRRVSLTTSLLLLILFSALSLLFFLPQTRAQEAERLDLTVSPVFFDFKADPGAEIKEKIRLRNNANTPVKLKVEIKKLTASDVREANLEDPRPEDQFVNWVKFDTTSFEAKPREWMDLPFTITIPQDASFGYYFSFNLTQDNTQQSPSQPTAVILGSIAVPVLLNVNSPNAKVEGNLLEFKPKNFINEVLPVDFLVKVNNTGNVHIKPRGNIFIRGGGDKDLAILEVNEGMGTILPQGSREYVSSWGDGFIVMEKVDEEGQTKSKLKVNWNKLTNFRIGPYTASLLMVYDNGTRDVTMESTTTFWVLPYKAIIAAVAIIVILVLVVRYFLKSYVNSQIKKSKN